mmetsp:Transcript_19665/g.32992  ORF Transcript_19665/g.32992 Transcript_19665/m.32992 type:complete len:201 (-) Transcript_19665:1984-2586(-)
MSSQVMYNIQAGYGAQWIADRLFICFLFILSQNITESFKHGTDGNSIQPDTHNTINNAHNLSTWCEVYLCPLTAEENDGVVHAGWQVLEGALHGRVVLLKFVEENRPTDPNQQGHEPRRNHGLPTTAPCIVQQGEAFHKVFQLQDAQQPRDAEDEGIELHPTKVHHSLNPEGCHGHQVHNTKEGQGIISTMKTVPDVGIC